MPIVPYFDFFSTETRYNFVDVSNFKSLVWDFVDMQILSTKLAMIQGAFIGIPAGHGTRVRKMARQMEVSSHSFSSC